MVVGGATGMGAAAAELARAAGADVVVMDFAKVTPGVAAIRVNLAERASMADFLNLACRSVLWPP